MAALVVPLSVLVASWAGLALVLVGARARTFVLALSVAALMVPLTALLVPRFAVFQWLGLVDSFVPLVAPALLGAVAVLRAHLLRGVSPAADELYDAAGWRE